MNKCRRCGVIIDGATVNCPLCGAHVNEGNIPSVYDYPEVSVKTQKQIVWQWSLFISLMAIAVSMVVDLAVNKTITWSVHVLFGLALPWICIARPLLLKFNLRKHLSWGFLGVIALLFYLNGWVNVFAEPWAFWLGAPVAVLVWQSALEILCIADKSGRADYEMSLTKLCALSLICIGISFAWLKECTWGWYVCAGRGAIDVVALCIFAKHDYFGELKRRLHI